MIVLAILEAATPSALISIWFAVGALGALIATYLTANIWIQIAVFFIISGICFATLRPITRKYLLPNIQRTNADRLIGQEAIVVETIDNLAGTGQVAVSGQTWTARSKSGEPIDYGKKVLVLRIEGAKLIVRPQEQADEHCISQERVENS